MQGEAARGDAFEGSDLVDRGHDLLMVLVFGLVLVLYEGPYLLCLLSPYVAREHRRSPGLTPPALSRSGCLPPLWVV